jgi:hypothetical protein
MPDHLFGVIAEPLAEVYLSMSKPRRPRLSSRALHGLAIAIRNALESEPADWGPEAWQSLCAASRWLSKVEQLRQRKVVGAMGIAKVS